MQQTTSFSHTSRPVCIGVASEALALSSSAQHAQKDWDNTTNSRLTLSWTSTSGSRLRNMSFPLPCATVTARTTWHMLRSKHPSILLHCEGLHPCFTLTALRWSSIRHPPGDSSPGQPAVAVTHLGWSQQVPFFSWFDYVPLLGPLIRRLVAACASPASALFMRRTGAHFFLRDRDRGRPPLLVSSPHPCTRLPELCMQRSHPRQLSIAAAHPHQAWPCMQLQ